MTAYRIGLREAHNTARYCLRLAREQAAHARHWMAEASRHFERARWYAQWIRRGF